MFYPFISIAKKVLIILLCSFIVTTIGCNNRPVPTIYDASTRILDVPCGDGRPVMTDGIFQPEEWDDASKLIINDSVSILFKQYQGHFFLALDSRKLLSPSLDLFLCADSPTIQQLHVSAQLGERKLPLAPEIATDTVWVWGKTSNWYANEFRWIYRLLDSLINVGGLDYETAIKQAGFAHEAIEIDLLQSKIAGAPWFFRIEIWTARMGEKPLIFPPETDTDNLDRWARFELK
jgi:hypothetical protein